VVNHGGECFRWQDAGDDVVGYDGVGVDPTFNSVLLDCDGGLALAGSDATSPAESIAADANNSTAVADTLTSTFINGSAESAVTALDPSTLDSFFDAVDYIGAVEDASDTWWQGWSCGLEASDPC
jgi:hypothetical protein